MTQQTEEQQVAVVKEFLENVCPTGLKTAQGTLSSTDAEKLGQFIDHNYEGVWSI